MHKIWKYVTIFNVCSKWSVLKCTCKIVYVAIRVCTSERKRNNVINTSLEYLIESVEFLLIRVWLWPTMHYKIQTQIQIILMEITHTSRYITGADPGFYVGGALLGEGSGKYRTSFLNRNWLKLYHVRYDALHRRYVRWSMIFYSWRKALLRLQYEEQQSQAFACSRKICVILFNDAHYTIHISLRSKE
jgi:hypothetical protein